jgi:signal transduction histidine kinase
MVEEADKQKTTFIQNVSHQIRTPLNIIMGFAQVLSDGSNEGLSDEETKSITDMMDHNSKHLNRMLLMLFDSSDTGLSEELNSQKQDIVPCNDVVNEAIGYTNMHYPNLHINFQTDVPDDFSIKGNRLYLMRALRELLYNSAKYSDGKNICIHVMRTENIVRFMVEDTGKNISEADSKVIFKFFAKGDDLTEGLGLGLPLAKRHAQNLGGDLILDTNYHQGCRFIIEIPY